MGYKEILDQAVSAKNFKLNAQCLACEEIISETASRSLAIIKDRVAAKIYKNFKTSIIRSSFLIELTIPSAESDSTKYQVRWAETLRNDVRHATYEQCVEIFEKICQKISLLDEERFNVLVDYCSNSIFNNELPIDYIDRHANPFHIANNIDIFITEDIIKCTLVRKLIKDKQLNPKAEIFQKIVADKIKVKAYQTDRAQTGTYKTNREKRWESHPDNYQFAFRRDCNAIEALLILQVCMFEGANSTLVELLKEKELLSDNFELYRCPVTGEVIKYNDFENEILHRVHGKSSFQVGHLNPLKSTGLHNANNIGWISDDGNRIQGSLSMEEVDQLLIRIYRNRPELLN